MLFYTNYYYKKHLQHTEKVNSLCLKRDNQLKNHIKEEKSAKHTSSTDDMSKVYLQNFHFHS